MSGVNKVIIVGRLGNEPEVRHTTGGHAVATLSLATSEKYKDQSGQQVEDTEWHRVTLWRGVAEVAEKYLHKGDQVYIEGKLKTRSWEKDGITRYTTEIVGSNLVMLGSAQRQQGYNPPPPAQQQQQGPPPQGQQQQYTQQGNQPPMNDDLPF